MTEEEAKTKWCFAAKRVPYASAREADEIALRGIDPDYEREMAAQWPCIASACMAWRTENTADGLYQVGYCGLAGRPG